MVGGTGGIKGVTNQHKYWEAMGLAAPDFGSEQAFYYFIRIRGKFYRFSAPNAPTFDVSHLKHRYVKGK
jgi:hypothetical protein